MFKKILIIIVVFLLAVVGSCSLTLIRKPNENIKDYDNVISESVSSYSSHITDIALLGAHDAFSDGINFNSSPDPNDGGICNNKVVNALGKGLVVRLSRAQNESAKVMLYSGVRYFDVRITKVDGIYYAYHGYLSDLLETYLFDIVEFLNSHPKEYVIFDIQHFYVTSDRGNYSLTSEDYQELTDFLSSVKVEGKSIMDYVNYDIKDGLKISDLTYGDVTNNGSKAGVVMLAKVNDSSIYFKRDGDGSDNNTSYTSIRSVWINKNSHKDMLEGIEKEVEVITTQGGYKNVLRVNQAQKTGFITDITLLRSLVNWSLINLADNFNKEIVSDKDRFMEWLEAMPILMVDFATSEKGDFNNKAIEYIKEYNINKGY